MSSYVARQGTDPDYGPGATRDGGGWVSEKPSLDFPSALPALSLFKEADPLALPALAPVRLTPVAYQF